MTDTASPPNVVSRRDFLPFGEHIPANATFNRDGLSAAGYNAGSSFSQQFTAKERDDESGLDYFLARYYSASLGRFTSVDPGSAGASRGDPQTWNGYSYTRNNPTIFIDPDGKKLRLAAGQSSKNQDLLIQGLARQYSTAEGRAQIERVARSEFEVEVTVGRLPVRTTGPAAGPGTTFGTTSSHVTGGLTEVETVSPNGGGKIAVIRGPEGMEANNPIRVTVDPENARRIGKSIPKVLAHELGGHTTTILDAAEQPIPGSTFPSLDVSNLDADFDEPGAKQAERIGKIPGKASQESIEAIKRILESERRGLGWPN